MPFGSQDVQSAEVGDARAQLDVRAAARHVGCDGHGSSLSGARHDLGFLHMELRVQHVVWNLLALQHSTEQLRSFDAY